MLIKIMLIELIIITIIDIQYFMFSLCIALGHMNESDMSIFTHKKTLFSLRCFRRLICIFSFYYSLYMETASVV
jgi:hypothetical protein